MTDPLFFFGGWAVLVRIVVVGVGTYIALVAMLRASGSRTLADANAFDFVVTVAIGSVFGGTLTARGISLSEAGVAFAVLVGMQYLVAKLQVAWPATSRAVTNPPALLYFRGAFLDDAMDSQRVTEGEVRAAARKHGHASLSEVEAVVLESSGAFSVLADVDDAVTFAAGLDQANGGGGGHVES